MSCTDEVPSVEREIVIPAPAEQLWESLPALLGDDVELEAEPGGRIRVRGPEGEHVGTVEEAEAPRRLAFWWVPAGGDEPPSRVEIELTGVAAGTIVHIRETRFDADAVSRQLLRGPLAHAAPDGVFAALADPDAVPRHRTAGAGAGDGRGDRVRSSRCRARPW